MTTALDDRAGTRALHLGSAVAVAVATALLVLVPGLVGEHGRPAAVFLLQVALAAGWVLATGPSGALGVVVLALAAAVGADLLVALADRPGPGVLLAVAGPALLAAVLHQMLRRPPRRDVVGSLGSTALLVTATCALALLLLPEVAGDTGDPVGSPLIVVGAALAAGHLVDAVLPRPAVADGVARGVPGLLLALAAGVAVALVDSGAGDLVDVLSGVTTGLVLGLAAALAGLATSFALTDALTGPDADADGARPAAGLLVAAALPLALCAPVLLVLAVA
ncbi:hypothetical protein JOD57_001963 [Geodermatophilus bullaregiensis]|uniref:hypothetical protein n=1 Tax=Geodermatophilus bullaregiensis TaxID=1564160 RepID=UPI00195979CC|nr:hypothetical protein [Geodermatophilus bullaregiensis]MBM7806126.1 hypothetical protein [Geodermatophilus bullaregiensis]